MTNTVTVDRFIGRQGRLQGTVDDLDTIYRYTVVEFTAV